MATAPTGLSVEVTGVGDGGATVKLTWTNHGDGIGDAYQYVVIGYSAGVWHEISIDGRSTTYSVGITLNTTWQFRVKGYELVGGDTAWSTTVNIAAYTTTQSTGVDLTVPLPTETIDDSPTGETDIVYESPPVLIRLLPTCSEGGATTDTQSTGVTLTVYYRKGIQSPIDYAYYLADNYGKVFNYSSSYKSDDGEVITCTYTTKDSELSDQDVQCIDKMKTLHEVKLWYIDTASSVTYSIGVSIDGGNTWTNKSASLGTGTGTAKNHTFWFYITGQKFMIRVQRSSTSATMQLLGIECAYDVRGEHFSLS
jgi:hypothetical protein